MSAALADVLDSAVPFAVPLRVGFRGLRRRIGLLLPGSAGWGEFAPFDDYPPPLAGRWLAAALEAAHAGWPAPVRDSVAVNAIVPALRAGSPELSDVLRSAQRAGSQASGSTLVVKVKVTGDLAADTARLAEVRAVLGADAGLRIDINQGWSLEQALEQLPALAEAAGGVEYVEQPLASLAETAQLRRTTGIPVAVDESLRRAIDPFDPDLLAAVRSSADVAVLKVAPLGGVRAVLRLAEALAIPVVVSGAMDTSIGLSAGIAAACALPMEPRACGLGTGALLAADLIASPLLPRDGRLSVVSIAPEPDALAAASAAVTAAEEVRVRQRLVEAWEHR